MIISKSILTFEVGIISWESWGISENCFKPKNESPLRILTKLSFSKSVIRTVLPNLLYYLCNEIVFLLSFFHSGSIILLQNGVGAVPEVLEWSVAGAEHDAEGERGGDVGALHEEGSTKRR